MEENKDIIYGINTVAETVENRGAGAVDRVIVDSGKFKNNARIFDIVKKARKLKIQVQVVPDIDKIKELRFNSKIV